MQSCDSTSLSFFSWEGTLPQDQNKKYRTMFVLQTSVLTHLINSVERIKNQWGFWVAEGYLEFLVIP